MLVARQLVRRELKTEPEEVIGVVREALGALPVAARNVRLMLHPEDAALVREAMPTAQGEQQMQIVEDPVQTRGGCRVLTDSSQIDASVEARLNAVIAHVLGGERSSDVGVAIMLPTQRSAIWSQRLDPYLTRAEQPQPLVVAGKLTRMVGLTLEAVGCQATIGGALPDRTLGAVMPSKPRWWGSTTTNST